MKSPFARTRLIISGDLEVFSPLHLGSGDESRNNALEEVDGEKPEVKLVQRDFKLRPYIPGSSLKGVMRAICERNAAKTIVETIFGAVKGDESGQMGALTVYGAELKSSPAASRMPYFGDGAALGTGVMARVKIDRSSGTASDHHLFHEEEVPVGTLFAFRCCYVGEPSVAPPLLKDLLAVMKAGFSAGAGTKAGQGALRLVSLKLLRRDIDPISGKLTDTKIASDSLLGDASNLAPTRVFKLRLTCDGPFFTNDPSWPAEREKLPRDNKNVIKAPHLRSLGLESEKETTKPVLPGSSLKGALRSLSLWLERGKDKHTTRLFGSSDAAAKLQITSIEPLAAGATKLTSVRLDRFSGAPIDNALFETLCYVDPVFEVTFASGAEGETAAHLERLLRHICEEGEGLRLGHGTNRGFGWFSAERQRV